MQQDPLGSFKVANKRRDATAAIRGYVYQVNVTLLRWITLRPGEALELEAGEDIDKIQKALADDSAMERLFEGVKHREKRLTLRSPEALGALAAFHEHRQTNSSLKLKFRYVTNASIGTENPSVDKTQTPGIFLWEGIQSGRIKGRQKSSVILSVRSLLKQCSKPANLGQPVWNLFLGYLNHAKPAELNRFIDAFEWSMEQGSNDETEGQVRFELANSGKLKSQEDAERAYAHLFHFVFALLTRCSNKVLTAQLLSSELAKLDQADKGLQIVKRLDDLKSQVHSRLDAMDYKLDILIDRTNQGGPAESPQNKHAQPGVNQGDASEEGTVIDRVDNVRIGSPSPNIVSSALMFHNEALVAALGRRTKDQVKGLRDIARSGRRSDALREIQAQKADRGTWHILSNESKAEFLRLEASILLGMQEDTSDARRLLEEAHQLAPNEDDSRLRACIAFFERDLETADRILEGKEQPESRNLSALFILLAGRAQDCLERLPPLDTDKSVRAETLRILCLARLQTCDIANARRSIDDALAAQPDWPVLHALDARVMYYEALAPAALPPSIDGSPDYSSLIFIIDSAENRHRLRKAAEMLLQLSNSTENSVEDRRSLEAWRLLCLTADRSRPEEANNYANDVFARDPGQYRIIPWLIAQRSAGVNFAPMEKALEAEIEADPNIIFQVISLVMVKIHESKTTEALEILETARPLFIKEKNEKGWQHLRSLALWRSGKTQEAKSELQQFDIEKYDPLWSEILRSEAQQSGDWDSYAQYMMNRYKSTKAADALLDYCDFEARRKNWAAVADLAPELMTRIGTAGALRIAAMANLYANRPAECLRILHSNQNLFADVTVSEQLHQLSIAAKAKSGDLISARQEAEGLSQTVPSTENLVTLARLQLNTGDLKALAINARHLHERKDLDSGSALQLAALIRREDANLAESLWSRALAGGVPDEQIGAAISLGYQLGLDKQLQPLLIRMYALAEAGEQGVQRKTFADLLEYAKQHHQDLEWANSLYRAGELAIHLIPHNLRDQLATLYHDRLLEREDNDEILGGLYTRHGGRLLINGFTETAPQWRVALDITSVLLAEHLGVLEKIAQGFGPVRLPPSIFLALTAMQYNVSTAQISQIQAAHDVIAAIENNEITVVDLPDTFSTELPIHFGDEWLRLYEAARLESGYIIDFLPKHDAMMEKVLELPADTQSRLLNCRAAVEALRTNGGISDDEYVNALAALGAEGALQPVGSVIQGSHLYCQTTVAKLLAQAKLIKPISRIFTISLSRKDLEDLKATTQHHARQQQLTAWLDNLIAHLRQGTAQGKFELATVSHDPKALADKDRNFDVECLLELLSVPSEPNDVICSDDRYFNAYARTESAPLISILELLKALVAAKELTIGEYYRLLVRLRAAGAFFIPLDADEILHHLSQAPTAKNIHSFETRELAIIRRYWARCLLNGQALQKPSEPHPANKDGEAYFLQASINVIRDTLTSIWVGSKWNDRGEKELRSEWLLQSLHVDHVGIKCLAGLPPSGATDQELAGITLGSMVLSAFKEQLSNPARVQSIKDLLEWLEDRLLRPAFEKDKPVLQSAAHFIRASMVNIWRSFTKEQAPYATKLVLMILDLLPETLRTAVWEDEVFNSELKIKNMQIVQVGELRFFREDYLPAAVTAFNGTAIQIRTCAGEQITVEPGNRDGSPELVLVRAAGEKFIVADPLLGLLCENVEDREKSLNKHPDWWDCSHVQKEKVIQGISREDDPAKRIDEAQRWRDDSAAVYYNNLPQILKSQGFILAQHLRPPSEDSLLRHYRLPLGNTADFRNGLLAAVLEISDANGISDAFVRYAGFPIPIPVELYGRLMDLSRNDQYTLIKTLLRVAGSPVSTVHFLRLLVHLDAGEKGPYRRLATRVLRYLTSENAKEELIAFRRILIWVENAFAAWSYFFLSSAPLRLAMVWAHAHRIYSTLKYLGIPPDWIVGRFEHEDFGLFHHLLGSPSEYRHDVVHPNRIMADAFVLDGLCYAIGSSFHWTELERQALLNLIYPVSDGTSRASVGLLRDTSLASNFLGSFLQSDRKIFLQSLGIEKSTAVLLTENPSKVSLEIVSSIADNPTDVHLWEMLFCIIGDFPVPPELQSVIESAILRADVAPLVSSPDSCMTVLYAASLQAGTICTPRVTEHVSSQMIEFVRLMQKRSQDGRIPEDQKRALGILLEVCAQLARSSAHNHDLGTEFARLVTEIVNIYPAIASFYRPVFQGLWPCTASEAKAFWPLLIRSRAFDY